MKVDHPQNKFFLAFSNQFFTVSCQNNSFLVLFDDNFLFCFIEQKHRPFQQHIYTLHSIQLAKDCQKLHFAAKRFCKKFLLPTIYHDFRPIGKNIQVGMGAVGRGGGGQTACFKARNVGRTHGPRAENI